MEKPVDIDALNQVLRDELSALETYHQALDKNRQEYGQDAMFMQIDQMCRDHEHTAHQLRSMIRSLGGTESQDSGAWGAWAKTVMGTAKLLGDKAALKAMKEGEESGIMDYEDVLHNRTAPPDVQSLLTASTSDREYDPFNVCWSAVADNGGAASAATWRKRHSGALNCTSPLARAA